MFIFLQNYQNDKDSERIHNHQQFACDPLQPPLLALSAHQPPGTLSSALLADQFTFLTTRLAAPRGYPSHTAPTQGHLAISVKLTNVQTHEAATPLLGMCIIDTLTSALELL